MNRRAPLAGLLLASTLSLLGSRMTMIALPWLVLVSTGSAAKTGLVGAAELVPYVLACALGGPVIDKIGGRRISVVADLLSLVVVGAIPLLHRSGGLGLPVLMVLVAVAGLLRGFGDTAKRGAMFPQVVAKSGVEMTRAATLVDGTSRAAGLIGGILAGPLIVWFGDAADVLLLDAVSFGLCALLVGLLVRVPGKADRAAEPYGVALRGGLAYLRGDRLVLGLILMLFVTNMLDQGFSAVLVPLWARDIFGTPVGIGLVGGSFGLGAVLGNIAFGFLAPRLPRWALFSVGFLIAGAPRFFFLAFGAPAWSIVVLGLIDGVAIAAVNPILSAVMYERVPEHLQARVQGLGTAVAFAGMPLGALAAGWLGEYGAQLALIVCGVAYLLATLAPFVGKFWREMDRRPAPVVTPELVAA
ncbi:MAG: MFS transporter [Hamadaea sp.]|uniref:MFS transporter n=1 Tax=Hamadaea sp. TaxID=2024425 RepID=UPI0017BF42CD|nr:MFS transporter [Hamadaea sp.]NUR70960.1 MFS transporter [Hamadaea sp.]NUT20071.1 MFS transporter [Hamadaea sp.]